MAAALEEDQAHADATSLACIPADLNVEAKVKLKQVATLAGLQFLPWIFQAVNPKINVALHGKEGEVCGDGMILATLHGPARSILSAERCALNLLQHLCGIATTTAQFVKEVKGYSCDILDTRKTLPNLRMLQKYAVSVGGGINHRFSLADRILIKNNHLSLLRQSSRHPIEEAIKKARMARPHAKIEVEVEDLNMLEEALSANADQILLDNMDLEMVQEAVRLTDKRAYLEASGRMTLSKVRPFAAAGVDGISIGALTHSVSSIDISLCI